MNDKDVTVATVADLATENKTLSESDNVKKEEVYQDPGTTVSGTNQQGRSLGLHMT